MTKIEPAPKMLTVSAAARRTGLPLTSIRRALEAGDLTYVQPNGPSGWKLIPPKDLDTWMKKITKPGKS